MTPDEFYRHLGAYRKQWDEAKELFKRLYDQSQKMQNQANPEDLERYSKQLTKVQDDLAVTLKGASRLWLVMIGDMTDAAYLTHKPQLDLADKLEPRVESPTRPAEVLDFTPKH